MRDELLDKRRLYQISANVKQANATTITAHGQQREFGVEGSTGNTFSLSMREKKKKKERKDVQGML